MESKNNNKLTQKNNQNLKINSNKIFGFWIYIMSDFIIFSTLFTVYYVLTKSSNFIVKKNIFNIKIIFIETIFLLISNFACTILINVMNEKKINETLFWLIVTFFFGFSFTITEIYEFLDLFNNGYTPSTNSFFSSVFAILGIHNIHIILGLVWIITMIFHLNKNGINAINYVRLKCLSFFWHFLDIIWLLIITIIYLY